MSPIDMHEIKTCGELCVALVNCGWWPRNDAQHERIKAVWERIVHLPAAPVVTPTCPKCGNSLIEHTAHGAKRRWVCPAVRCSWTQPDSEQRPKMPEPPVVVAGAGAARLLGVDIEPPVKCKACPTIITAEWAASHKGLCFVCAKDADKPEPVATFEACGKPAPMCCGCVNIGTSLCTKNDPKPEPVDMMDANYWIHIFWAEVRCKERDGIIMECPKQSTWEGQAIVNSQWAEITAAEYEAAKAKAEGKAEVPTKNTHLPECANCTRAYEKWCSYYEPRKTCDYKQYLQQRREPFIANKPAEPKRIEKLAIPVGELEAQAKVNELIEAVNERLGAK